VGPLTHLNSILWLAINRLSRRVFSGDSKTRSPSTAHSPSSPESLELPEMKYPILLGPHPETSFVDNLVFTFGSLRDSGDGDEQEQWQDDTGTLLQHTGTFFPFDNGTSIAYRE